MKSLVILLQVHTEMTSSSSSPIMNKKWWATALIYTVLSSSLSSHAFYHQETNKHTYSTGEEMTVKVNSLTSIRTQVPFSYYGLPYCHPAQGIKEIYANIGQLLMGDRIFNSPYRFKMNVNESRYICTTSPLTEYESKTLKKRTRDLYRVNMVLDYLPAMRFANKNGIAFQVTGFPVGYTPRGSEDDYIINHLKFKVLVHEYKGANNIEAGKNVSTSYEIVGFEVVPCSIRHDLQKMVALHMFDNFPSMNCPSNLVNSQLIRKQYQISYTYEVEFVKSNIKWQSRCDAFLRMENVRVHWFSILYSFMVIFFLSGFIFGNLWRTMRRGKGAQAEMKQEFSGWEPVVGDVFKEPHHSKLLCVMVANGVQILGTSVVITVLGALGVTSPASQGMLLTWAIYVYLFLGSLGGYVGVRLCRTIKRTSEGWKSISMSIASFFPSIVFVIFTTLNFIHYRIKSSGAIPISLYFLLLSLWICISIPLTILGGFLATTRAETIKFSMETSQIPRKIPRAHEYMSWLLVLVAGWIPFGTLFVELYYILSSLWFGRSYDGSGFLLIVLMILLVVCAEVSVVATCKHFNVEDCWWWWKAFYACASAALYVFLYSIFYLVINLRGLSGAVSVTIYLGKSMIIAIAIMLSTGAIGFLASLCTVHHVYSSLNLHSSMIGKDLETLLLKD